MQAIVTTYRGPTDTRGSRIHARAGAGSVSVGYDQALSLDANHQAAAIKLAHKFAWRAEWVTGNLPNGDYVHVQTRSDRHWERFQTVVPGAA